MQVTAENVEALKILDSRFDRGEVVTRVLIFHVSMLASRG